MSDAIRLAAANGRPVGQRDSAKPDKPSTVPDDCPILPLGQSGPVRYYLDGNRRLVPLTAKEHTRLELQGLFGENFAALYCPQWARWSKPKGAAPPEITGWRPELVAQDLMAACDAAGEWDPADRERGRGAWRTEDGELVLHTGQRLLVFQPVRDAWRDHASLKPGLFGRHVYPAAEALAQPSPNPATDGADGPAHRLLTVLETWNWRRGETDALLLLGWLGAAMIGGALSWRPHAWITGGKGTGKSTLHEIIRYTLGEGLMQVANATEASIRQTLKMQSLPVAFDELEASEDNRQALAVIGQARIAASGGKTARGGSNHQATSFEGRSCYLLSSILIPPMGGADRSRFAVLELEPLAASATEPKLDAPTWRAVGTQLRRRLVDGWWRFDRTLAYFREHLKESGHTARSADQFGALLACADLLLHSVPPDPETSGDWAARLAYGEIAETAEDQRDEDLCLNHLLSSSVDFYRNGGRKPLAMWVRIAAGMEVNSDAFEGARVLESFGLKWLAREQMLAVANTHRSLADVFKDTHWAGKSGAAGVYVQSLRRLAGAERATKVYWFSGVASRATLVPMGLVAPRLTPDGDVANGGML
jgi:hypothetical protein